MQKPCSLCYAKISNHKKKANDTCTIRKTLNKKEFPIKARGCQDVNLEQVFLICTKFTRLKKERVVRHLSVRKILIRYQHRKWQD